MNERPKLPAPAYVFPEVSTVSAPTVAEVAAALHARVLIGTEAALGRGLAVMQVTTGSYKTIAASTRIEHRLATSSGNAGAGQAKVFVFPDLNTCNNTYKVVQRSGGTVAVGPVMQGLRRPVDDLYRRATVKDIVNTIAMTAIQAGALVVSEPAPLELVRWLRRQRGGRGLPVPGGPDGAAASSVAGSAGSGANRIVNEMTRERRSVRGRLSRTGRGSAPRPGHQPRVSIAARPADRGQFIGGGPVLRVPRQRYADHLVQARWQAGQVRLHRVQPQDPFLFVLAGERVDAGGQVRHEAAPGEDIHRRRRRGAPELFRCGPAAAALHHPANIALPDVPGDAEVDDAHVVAVDQQVRRLHVTMHDASGVNRGERAGQRRSEPPQLLCPDRPAEQRGGAPVAG
jgi:hypothetical protein